MYEQIARAKINFDKSKCLRLGARRGGLPHPRGMVRARPPAVAKLVGGTGKDKSAVVLKGKSKK